MSNFNLPPGVTDADIDALSAPDPAPLPAGCEKRVRAVVAALHTLHAACTAMIEADEDHFAIGDLYPSEWLPDPLPTVEGALTNAQAWADDCAAHADEVARDSAYRFRYED